MAAGSKGGGQIRVEGGGGPPPMQIRTRWWWPRSLSLSVCARASLILSGGGGGLRQWWWPRWWFGSVPGGGSRVVACSGGHKVGTVVRPPRLTFVLKKFLCLELFALAAHMCREGVTGLSQRALAGRIVTRGLAERLRGICPSPRGCLLSAKAWNPVA
jgi:hypothetical protein